MSSEFEIVKKQEDNVVGYTGEVEIGVIRKGKRFKKISSNKGKIALFRYLRDCLGARLNPDLGINIGNRPGGLVLLDESNTPLVSYGYNFTDIEYYDNDSDTPTSQIVFNFLIPGTTVLGQQIKKAKLVAINNTGIEYAETVFEKALLVKDVDTNIYVSWKLTIGNGQLNI